ncbi:hypothetical protein E2542_SST00538 [Spatholobus suberectus]|nr:hypothetical protein E2542_SST00538 [Spatholobus suberectus]
MIVKLNQYAKSGKGAGFGRTGGDDAGFAKGNVEKEWEASGNNDVKEGMKELI